CSTQLSCSDWSCGTRDAGAIPAASTSRPLVRNHKWPSLLHLRRFTAVERMRAATRRLHLSSQFRSPSSASEQKELTSLFLEQLGARESCGLLPQNWST